MRIGAGALKTFLDTQVIRYWTDLFTLSLSDGSKQRWTSADVDVPFGGFTFRTSGALAPAIVRGPYEQSARLTIDTMDITLKSTPAFQIGGKTLPQLAAAGYFDFSRIQVDHLCGADLPSAIALGGIPSLFEGPVAGLDLQGPAVILRAKSELETLNILLPKFPLQPQCGNAVYDVNCGLNRATFTLTGTASGVPTRSVIVTASAALTAKAAGYFNLGVLAFTSGVNSGLRRAVKDWSSNTFTVMLPFPVAPAAGDAISVYPGCDRSKLQCGPAKFNNLAQYRGFPHMPPPEGGQ